MLRLLGWCDMLTRADCCSRVLRQYLHDHHPSIIHRDISAKNVLVSGGVVKIGDLGQARFFDRNSGQTAAPGAFIYRWGTHGGTCLSLVAHAVVVCVDLQCS